MEYIDEEGRRVIRNEHAANPLGYRGGSIDASKIQTEPCEERPHYISKNIAVLIDSLETLHKALDELFMDIDPVCRPKLTVGEKENSPPVNPTVQSTLAGKLNTLIEKALSLTLKINETRRRIDL